MNVLMLVKNSKTAGAVSCVKSLVEGLQKHKNAHTVIVKCEDDSFDYMLKDLDMKVIDSNSKSITKIIGKYNKSECRMVCIL